MTKRIALVTGASGFIGSRLIEELNQEGFEVRALMRKTSSAANLEGLRYERAEGDLGDIESLRRAVAGATHVFHLAGMISSPEPTEFYRHNAEGTANLARAAAEAGSETIQRFVYVSSLAAGGPKDRMEPRTETDPDQPVSTYGQSKLAGEKELLRHAGRFPISIIRPPLVYGPKDKSTFIFVKTVARRIVPTFGPKHYSTIHVADLCRGIAQAGAAGPEVPSGEVFYLAADEIISYDQLMGTIAEELRARTLRLPVPGMLMEAAAAGFTVLGQVTRRNFPLTRDKMNEIRPDFWICSNEKAKRLLGFRPKFEFRSGMADAIRWYREAGWV